MLEQRLWKSACSKQQHIVQTERRAAELLHSVHSKTGLTVIGTSLCEANELLNITDDLAHEGERIVLVIAERRVVLIDQPIINLILTYDCIAANVFYLIICHHEITQEPQRFLFCLFERCRNLLPFILEPRKIGGLHLGEQKVLE